MKQKINAAIFFFIISIFFKASFLFAQTQTNTITIHQEITFNASPGRIYQILLSSKEFSACTKKSFDGFTLKSADINSVVGDNIIGMHWLGTWNKDKDCRS